MKKKEISMPQDSNLSHSPPAVGKTSKQTLKLFKATIQVSNRHVLCLFLSTRLSRYQFLGKQSPSAYIFSGTNCDTNKPFFSLSQCSIFIPVIPFNKNGELKYFIFSRLRDSKTKLTHGEPLHNKGLILERVLTNCQ